jgi:hypothetical protein
MDQQKTRESIPDILRPKRTNISSISTFLNYNNNTPATAPAITQDLANSLVKPVSNIIGTKNFRF